jgi:dihydroorotate dehydrogenase (fumarate)
LIEQAGADALELNVYFVPTDARLSGERMEESTLELVQQVRSSINIPLAVIARPLISRDGEGEALRL